MLVFFHNFTHYSVMAKGASTARRERRQPAVAAQVPIVEVQRPEEPPLLRIPITAADLAQGSSHIVRISEGHYNPRGVTVFVPPVGYFPLLDETFFDSDALISPRPDKQFLDDGVVAGTYKLRAGRYKLPKPAVVVEPAPVVVPVAPLVGIATRSQRAGNYKLFYYSLQYHIFDSLMSTICFSVVSEKIRKLLVGDLSLFFMSSLL